VWALVIGTLVAAAAHTGFSFLLPGTYRERFRTDPAARHEVMHFGRWIFASSAVTFAASRSDQLVLGRLLGAASLGVYNIALALAELPDALVQRMIDGILFPAYGRVYNERPADLPRIYYRTRLALDTLAHTALGGLIALSPWIIHLLYDKRYQGAAPMLQILALRTSLTVLASPCETALFAQGLSLYNFRRNLAVTACTFIAMPVGHALGGATGLLWGTTVARAAALAMLWPAAKRLGILKLHRELLFIPLLASGYGMGRALLLILPHR
jgi:O-antigen/teichoic acid export membrane protein